MEPMEEKEALFQALELLKKLRESPHLFISESAKVMCHSLEGMLELFNLPDVSSTREVEYD